jgi:hypothetical protein
VPKYLIERRFQISEEQMPDIGRRSKEIIEEQFPEIEWEHSHVVLDDSGTVSTYCVYEAPSEEVVRHHAKELGLHDVVAVREIVGDVTPADFPALQA